MKYTILEVLPAQIKVEFEDSSWALVPIGPNQSPEEIDDAVSKYDPDFLPKPENLINKNISVGEERVSTQISNINLNLVGTGTTINFPKIDNPQFTPAVKLPVLTFGGAHAIDAVAIGNYFSEKGDNRIKDAITKNIEDFIASSNFSIEKMVNDLKDDSNDIMMQALAELEQEGIQNGNE